MKHKLTLVEVNEFLKKRVNHLLRAPKDDPYRIIIESLLGTRNVSLYKSSKVSIHKTETGIFFMPVLTGEVKYKRQIDTLKKKGILIDIGKNRMTIDPRFRKILKTGKYQPVTQLTKQQRNSAESQLKKKRVNPFVVAAILDKLDKEITFIRSWKDKPNRPLDKSLPSNYRTFCRIARKQINDLVFDEEPEAKNAKKSK